MTTIRRAVVRWLADDLYRKASACFAALLIYQWIRCLGDYWWSETFAIVNGMLLVAALANVFVPSKTLSVGVQLIALAGLNLAYSDFQWMPFEGSRRSLGDWSYWFGHQFEQLSPFIWISLGILAVFHVIMLLRRRRSYILLLTGAAVLSLAAADSVLTPIYLWEEIAWIVFIALGWLVASHFAGFKRRHPDNWEQLLEYPLSLFLPILLILTLVMAAGLFVPTVKPVLTDPYTAWKESRGETVPSFVGDKAITVAASKNDADTRSGYSRNDSMLGGGFTFDYTPVMEVTTNLKSYWRGETRALYNGTGWLESPEERAEDQQPNVGGGEALKANGLPASTKTETVEQSITMVRKDKFPVLFGAGPIAKVTSINGSADGFPALNWLPDSWELRLPRSSSASYPKTYELQSNVPILDEKALRAGAAAETGSGLSEIYLQLPKELPDRVKTLARDLTRNAATPYDKVLALISYLQTNYAYTNTPDLSLKSSKDFVDAFLFEMKEGYCDYFSTSLAVMTRSLGIPARWVKGYSSGSMPGNPSLEQLQGMPGGPPIDPDGPGTYTVRNADAHSWVEVYFNGYGWLPFEATPGFSYPYAMPEDEPAAVTPVEPADTGSTDAAPAEEDGGFSVKPWMFWAAAGLLALALAAYGCRAFPALLRRYRGAGDSVNARIVYETNRLIRHCRKKGLEVQKNETVRETMSRWSTRLTSLQPQFKAVQQAFENAMYSSRQLTEEEAERASASMKQIREHLG
ncbi:transglutaminase TgpA family protein [Paenibacillus sp. GCM10023250]|uniref:transglutaminase TgpA family protein n=1 Tax=Paenibacillus sp. GCM10023250 TaxID=3252648 RepID=UPI003620A1CE